MNQRPLDGDSRVSVRRVSWRADSEPSPKSDTESSDDEPGVDTATCGDRSRNASEAAVEQNSVAQRPSLPLLEAGSAASSSGAKAEPQADCGAIVGCERVHMCWQGCSECFAQWLPVTQKRLLRSLPVAATYFDGMFIFVLSRMWADLLSIYVFRLYPHPFCESVNIASDCSEHSPEWQLWLYAFGLLFFASLADAAMSVFEDRLPNVASTVRPILSMTCGWSFGDASVRGVSKRSAPPYSNPDSILMLHRIPVLIIVPEAEFVLI